MVGGPVIDDRRSRKGEIERDSALGRPESFITLLSSNFLGCLFFLIYFFLINTFQVCSVWIRKKTRVWIFVHRSRRRLQRGHSLPSLIFSSRSLQVVRSLINLCQTCQWNLIFKDPDCVTILLELCLKETWQPQNILPPFSCQRWNQKPCWFFFFPLFFFTSRYYSEGILRLRESFSPGWFWCKRAEGFQTPG